MIKEGHLPSREQESIKLSIDELAKKAKPLAELHAKLSTVKRESENFAISAVVGRLSEINPNFKKGYEEGRSGWETAHQMMEKDNPYLKSNQRLSDAERAELSALLHDTAANKYGEMKKEEGIPNDAEQQVLQILVERRNYCQQHPEQEGEIEARKTQLKTQIDQVLVGLTKPSGEAYYGDISAFGTKRHDRAPNNISDHWVQMIKTGEYPAGFLNNPSVQGVLNAESIHQLEALGGLKDELKDLDFAISYFKIENSTTEPVLTRLATEGTVFNQPEK